MNEFKTTISIDPNFGDGHHNLGLTYAQKKDYPDAIKEIQKAIDNPIYPTKDKALVNLGYVYDTIGDHEAAAKSFREALLAEPDNVTAMYSLADEYNKMNNTDEAEKLYKKTIEAAPKSPQPYFELGLIYFKQGKNAEAQESLEKAKQLAPNTDLAAQADKYLDLLK
jgi:Tfp pilus assembly protein PilF